MNHTTIRRALSFLLALCLVLGMIPSLGTAAKAAEAEQSPVLSALADDSPIDSAAKLQAAIDNVAEGGEDTFVVKSFAVGSPISITKGKRITILGASKGTTCLSADLTSEWKTLNGIFEMAGGTSLMLQNLTVDGKGQARCIYMWAGTAMSNLTLRSVVLTKGNAYGHIHGGAAICMEGNGALTIEAGCSITENTSYTSTVTSGAIYVGPGSTANFNGTAGNLIEFDGNTGHSGGAVYVFNAKLTRKSTAPPKRVGSRAITVACSGLTRPLPALKR